MTSEENNISLLEEKLKKSNERLEKSVKNLSKKHMGGEMEEYQAAQEENLLLQRKMSLAKKEETAMLCDWPVKWDTGAPLPHVISSGNKTFLIYYTGKIDPEWDGTYVKIIDPAKEELLTIAIVEFIHCYAYKFGGANDEVIHGHPLRGKGLEPYGAHIIHNSRWIKEEVKINSVHRYYKTETWEKINHYLLLFHDEIFECLAEGFKIEIVRDTFEHVLKESINRMIT
ncbi:MAG: hypothetical protein ABRQ39_21455 [Candidatus Eremiobacterota bacterium]